MEEIGTGVGNNGKVMSGNAAGNGEGGVKQIREKTSKEKEEKGGGDEWVHTSEKTWKRKKEKRWRDTSQKRWKRNDQKKKKEGKSKKDE